MSPKYEGDWSFGGAVHHANLVLGRVALASGDLTAAGEHLIRAGETPGGPGLNSFGPNMMLAKELLAHGQREVVLEYFKKCKRFWNREELGTWAATVREGGIPDFGANLVY